MTTTMKAVVWTQYGPPSVLQVQQVPKPTPSPSSILVKVRATGIAQGDCEMRGLNLPKFMHIPVRGLAGLIKPSRVTILGQEFAGIVEQVGASVTEFKVGDHVYGSTGDKLACYAEYVVVSEKPGNSAFVVKKPERLSFEEASVAALSAMEAISFLTQAKVKEGESVLVVGAGGNIGSFAVQLAKHHFRASRVVAIDGTNKVAMLESLGVVDKVVDFTKENYIKETTDRFDVILDTPGKSTFEDCSRILNEHGRYAKGMFEFSELVSTVLPGKKGTKRMVLGMATYQLDDFKTLTRLFEEGLLNSVIDRSFPLDDVVAAHTYSESGEKVGCITMTVGNEE
ncbi:chaperonin 10-like protein [Obelidium mucronatum]|nr:chaperonin 10-like protein [Obelidium mucronatum]